MHLHTLNADNFKRLKAVRIEFPEGGGAVEICGANGQGKSSTIDAVWAALGGARAAPEVPIRTGARKAEVSLDLGDLKVVRTWDGHGTRLTVTDRSGAAVSTPQLILDRLFNRLGFDPLEFVRMKPKEQADTLRRVAGLDFAQTDDERKRLFDLRTEANRVVRQQEARLATMPSYEPTEPVDVADLNRRLREVTRHNADVATVKDRLRQAENDLGYAQMAVGTAEEGVRDAQRNLEDARRRLDAAAAKVEMERHDLESAGHRVDPERIMDAIQQATAINERARACRERADLEANLEASRDHAARLTDQIDDLDAYRQRLLVEAKMPVEGLSLEGDEVTMDGIPLAQASSAERIRVGLAMAAAMAPGLKLVAIREGSLLDEASLRLVAAWAAANGYQVLVERVASGPSGVGVVIEEGSVKEERGTRRRSKPVGTPSMFDDGIPSGVDDQSDPEPT